LEDDSDKYLLMEFGTASNMKNIIESEEEEGELDLEGDLVNALDELRKAREKNKQLKEQLHRAK